MAVRIARTTLANSSQPFTYTGGSGTIGITSTCDGYFVQAHDPWITIPQSSGLLANNATASFSVAANAGAPRTGTITVGGVVFTIMQSAPPCYYTLDTTSALVPVDGGTGTINVTASASSCAWTAKSSDTSAITVSSGAAGTGNGQVKYSVPTNTGGPRTPTITIGDSTGQSVFTETQASAFSCTFTLSPSTIEVPQNGASNFVSVNASFPFCNWTATSNNPSALAVTNNPSGAGFSGFYYSVGQNTTGAPRTLTITAGCQTFTVNQDGPATTPPHRADGHFAFADERHGGRRSVYADGERHEFRERLDREFQRRAEDHDVRERDASHGGDSRFGRRDARAIRR